MNKKFLFSQTSNITHRQLRLWVILIVSCFSVDLYSQIHLEVLRGPRDGDRQFLYYSISCASDNNCTTVGSIYDPAKNPSPAYEVLIERTTDGGATWTKQSSGIPDQESEGKFLKKVLALDSLRIFAIGDSGLILRTIDAGHNWITLNSGTLDPLADISFSDSLHGIVISNRGALLVTSDGGDTWHAKQVDSSVWFTSCKAFSSSSQSVLKYGTGPLYNTDDQWGAWAKSSKIPDTTAPNIFRVVANTHFFDKNSLLAYGVHYVNGNNVNLGNAYITKSTDRGESWTDVYDMPNYLKRGILTISLQGQRGIACGNGAGLMFTTDGGATWSSDTVIADNYFIGYTSSSFPVGDDVFLVGNIGFMGGVLKLHFPNLLKTEAYEEIIYGTYIYPNPASKSVTIRTTYSDAKEIYLFDALGRKIMTIPCEGKEEVVILCNDLPIGIYKTVISWRGMSVPGKQLVIMR